VEIYVQCDVAFDPKAIILGSNQEEFWLAVKPKEISSYWWGRWADQTKASPFGLGPRILLEAIGLGLFDTSDRWSLSKRDGFDVLTRWDNTGRLIKKVYVDSCDFLEHRIEYFDSDGELVAVVELGKYKQVIEGFSIPTRVTLLKMANGRLQGSARLKLSSLKHTEFSQRQREVIFHRPKPKGFKRQFLIVEGKPVEIRGRNSN